jgi:hypothetical protein
MLTTVNGTGSAGPQATVDPAPESATSAAASSGLRRLHPADGLFLRAEHLDQIQTYARDLAHLGALAGGSGVGYGFTLDLDPGKQLVGAGAGLAIDPSGQVLRSLGRLEVDLSRLARDVAGRVWIVEVVAAAPIPAGNEPVFTAACAGPCGPDSSIQPWLDTAVELRVRADTLTGDWVDADAEHALSALVSAYFDRERRGGSPWLTPASAGAAVPRLASRPWATGAPPGPPAPAGVPLGLLAWIGGGWCLDVWSARRDRALTPPEVAWQNRLSLRPQPVFTAQVLQFENQLSAGPADPAHPLTDRFVELPPAGYLPRPEPDGDRSLEDRLDAVFAGAARLRLVRCTADAAVTAVGLAQHLNRIPLRANADPPVDLVILVPDIAADLPALSTPGYGWVAFVREPQVAVISRRRPDPSPTPAPAPGSAAPAAPAAATAVQDTATVRAHVVEASSSRARYAQRLDAAAAGAPAAEIRFPGGGWELAADASAVRRLRKAVDKSGPYSSVDVVATTADPAQEPLAAARARALAAQIGIGDTDPPGAVYATRRDGPDAVFLMVRRTR